MRPGVEAGATAVLLAFAAFSVATGLFVFGCFKLMSFHWISINVLVSLLLVGMPVGGILAARSGPATVRGLSVSLALQMAAMAATLALLPLFTDPAIRIDTLLARPGESGSRAFLILKFGELGIVFTPLFIAIGASELLGYRLVLPIVRDRSELAYAILLVGFAVGYGVLELGAPRLGVLPLLLGAAGTLGVVAAGLRFREGAARAWRIGAVGTALLVAAALPGLEDRYLLALESPSDLQFARVRDQPGVEVLHRGWSRYCHLTIAALSATATGGYYNGGLHWFYFAGRTLEQVTETFDDVPFAMLPPRAQVLIIGAGGGQQVRTALLHEPARVVAVEVIPEVLDLLRGPLADRVERVYEDPRVETVAMDGRRYLEQTPERFDLIYLPIVDTGVSMLRSLFNAAEDLYTVEAFAVMAQHLTDGGVLVIQRPAFIDPTGILVRQYVRALAELGMHPYAWLDDARALPGAAEASADAAQPRRSYFVFARRSAGAGELPPAVADRLRRGGFLRVDDFGDFHYLAKTDDFLLRSNILFTIIGGAAPQRSAVLGFAAVAAIALVIVAYLRRVFGRLRSPPLPFWALLSLGVLTGLNFVLLQQCLIFKLFRILPRPMDAMFIGTVGFLLLASVGGLVLTGGPWRSRAVLAIAVPAVALLGFRVITPESTAGLLVAVLLVMVTGALFPSVFRGGDTPLLVVFAADALGALTGGLVAFLWPIVYGFRSFDRLTLTVFLVTAAAVVAAQQRWRLWVPSGEKP